MIDFFKKPFNFFCKIFPFLILIAFAILCWRWFEFSNANHHGFVEPLINGIIGGIVTSLLILVFSIVWKSNITPWVENILYKDTKIEGVWDGVLIPYIGIEEIDKKRLKFAMRIIERRRMKRKEKLDESEPKSTELCAYSLNEDGEKEKKIDAELIYKETKDGEDNEKGELIDRKIQIGILTGVAPIEIRAEIKRVGHNILGQLVEIGGASQIHTYKVEGTFKNLILTGEYENENCSNIDRGSLSLMLRQNGNRLEGFFSSYADQDHQIAPFRCVLNRQRNSNKY